MQPRIKLGTSPASSSSLRNRSLDEHEIQQVAYLLGAVAVGDPVSEPSRLAAAGQTIHDVRVLLKHGRGNVAADIGPSHGYNGVASSVVKYGKDIEAKAARAAVMGAGVCNHYAGVTALAHAPHMHAHDTVAVTAGTADLVPVSEGLAGHAGAGHVWAEWRAAEGREGNSTIVMDAWANGPAVRLKDSRWANVPDTTDLLEAGRDEANLRKDRVEQLAPLLHPARDAKVARTLESHLTKPETWDLYAEAQVVSSDFANRASHVLSWMDQPQQAQIASVLAQQTYHLNDDKATSPRMVAAVLEQAVQLDRQGRPPIVPPSD